MKIAPKVVVVLICRSLSTFNGSHITIAELLTRSHQFRFQDNILHASKIAIRCTKRLKLSITCKILLSDGEMIIYSNAVKLYY
jgi:hypothetical protein